MHLFSFKNKFAEVVSLLLVFLFVYTAASKLLQPEVFRFHLQRAPFIAFAAPVLTWLIPALELAFSLLLLFPFTRTTGLWASLVLLCLFTLYLGAMLLSGSTLPCSCGGVIGALGWEAHVALNTFFLSLCAVALAVPGRQQAPVKKTTENTLAG